MVEGWSAYEVEVVETVGKSMADGEAAAAAAAAAVKLGAVEDSQAEAYLTKKHTPKNTRIE